MSAHDALRHASANSPYLQESEQRYALTLANIADAVIATDAGGLIVFMNSVAEAITGWLLTEPTQEAELRGRQVSISTSARTIASSGYGMRKNPKDRVHVAVGALERQGSPR